MMVKSNYERSPMYQISIRSPMDIRRADGSVSFVPPKGGSKSARNKQAATAEGNSQPPQPDPESRQQDLPQQFGEVQASLEPPEQPDPDEAGQSDPDAKKVQRKAASKPKKAKEKK